MTVPSGNFLHDLLNLPEIYGARVSPDGQWVAWTWLGIGETMDVFACPTDNSGVPIKLTQGDQHTWLVSWTPDSKSLIVAHDFEGNERAQLFRVNIAAPGTMHQLTEENPNYYLRGGSLHSNDRWLFYAANLDVATREEIEASWLYRHDLVTGERLPIARPLKNGYYIPRLNSSGTHLLYYRSDLHPAGLQMWVVDVDGRNDCEVLNFGADKKVYGCWHNDGQRIVFLAETDTHSKLGVLCLEDSSVTWLIDDPSRNIEDVTMPPNSPSVVLLETRSARLQASFFDLDTEQETPLVPSRGSIIPIAPAGNNGEWVGQVYSSTHVADIVRFQPANLEHQASLSRVWQQVTLTPEDLTQAENFHWKSDDGLAIQGWLYRAKSSVKGTIVYVHGGPTGHSEDAINHQIQYFVSQGFNVLDPNYRGSTGFSLAYRESIKEDGWGGREQIDIRAGIEALIKAGIATAGKVGITGTSYGGYSSWCAITRWSTDIIAASAPICGMTDLVVDYDTTRPDLRPYSEEMMGGSPSQVPDRYRERSPINHVANIRGKLLIVQGLRDPNVTPENVKVVGTALKQAGIPYELLTFEDEGHGIDRKENQRILYMRLAEFFEQAFSGI